ncbi:hypothetical protein [Paraburkholderia lycopersici]|uniref:hypothetical protein n=1 Tax=Paraburkholderia lycopersici TaxID=416944 RepID=UPI0011611B87|nr:hypothetical protein [Paraburkholderia lycopersici]
MQFEFACAVSSATVVAPRNAWRGRGARAGTSATPTQTGMQLAFACTGVVVPVRRFGVTDLAGEIAECLGGPEEGVMAFDVFTTAGREACRVSIAANMTRS